MLPFIALLFLSVLADAKVQFTYSTIYDEYDIDGDLNFDKPRETFLEACIIGGCSVYVSVPQWNAEVTKNLYVYNKAGMNVSLYSIATQPDVITWAKTGVHLSNTENSIVNYNKKKVGPIVIYVVGSQAPLYGDKEVEIYDASNINNRPAKNKHHTMIMSAEPFNLFVQAYGMNLKAFVRATGYDNNIERNSPDDCTIIYDQNEGMPFRLRLNSPVVSINFDGQFNYQICAKVDQYNGALLDYPGIATSQGYIGCKRNLFPTYRSSLYTQSEFEMKDDHGTDRDTELKYIVNTVNTDKVTFKTFTNKATDEFSATGNGQNVVTKTVTAYKINVAMPNQYGSSYWLGYTPKTGGISNASGQGICTDFTQTTSSSGVSQTAPTQGPTTSGANDFRTILTSAIVCFFALRF